MLLFLLGLLVAPGAGAMPVINEIHHDPPDPTSRQEFIELHNPSPTPFELGGWSLSGAVGFTFPAGSRLEPGGYLVVAQDPTAIQSRWGVAALGPWSGRLSGRDETLRLRDASGETVDAVDFRLGFPWPTVGDPPGDSIELIHPDLDNSLGGNWRASVVGASQTGQEAVLVPAGSHWALFRGRSEPPGEAGSWRLASGAEAPWEPAMLPAGYDPSVNLGTRLDDMRGAYLAVYFRKAFQVADPAGITALRLEALYDDGFRVWINGREVFAANLAADPLPFSTPAGPARESADYETFTVDLPAGVLRQGDNVVAVQAHNSSLQASSDFYFDVRITGVRGPTGRGPTPGRRNLVFATTAPPTVRGVTVSPAQPRSGEAVRVTARVADPEGVAAVRLEYQVVDPGAYIELSDPAYATSWTSVPMIDSGQQGDAVAGDGIHTAWFAGEMQRHRRLIRYRIVAEDTRGESIRVPYADDPVPNFAYFVYDGVPAWTGAVRPGAAGDQGRPFTVPAGEMNRLPVLHLIGKRSTVESSTWFSRYGGDGYPWLGTLVFEGRVYDHIRHRARGGVWRYAMVKNMWKFDFARGHDFIARDDWGRELAVPWKKLNLGASIQQGDYNHRGEQGMFESVGFRVFRLAGVPAMHSAYAQFRVIDDAEEAPADSQYDGDFWGVYLMLEQPDGQFLEQHDLGDGNLYKMEGGGGELNHLGAAGPSDGSDLRAFQNGFGRDEAWWRANLDVPSYLSYQAVVQAIHHYDICYDKNFFYYRDPDRARWAVIPWDLDLTWAENMYDARCGGVDRIKQRILQGPTQQPAIWRQWQNRIREFRDLFWNEDEAWRLIEEQAGRLRGPAAGPTLLDADRAQWDYNPRMVDPAYSSAGTSKAGWGRYYQWPNYPASSVSRDFDGVITLMKRYVGFRATSTAARARALDLLADDPDIPATPSIRYAGPEGYPLDRLRFTLDAYAGTAPMAAVRWRIGEVTRPASPSWAANAPWKYELEPVWESGDLTVLEPEVRLSGEALREGRVYRVRAQFRDAEGRTSHWSDPVEFTAGEPLAAQDAREALRVTELMYDAPGGRALDFLELHNAGDAEIDLGGSRFTEGVRFTLPPGTRLPPGGYLLVTGADPAGDFAQFRSAYGLGTEVRILGPYEGNLSEGGERIVLEAAEGGVEWLDFRYSDGLNWPVAADGAGHSLVPATAPARTGSALSHPASWRASTFIGGSPGGPDPDREAGPVLNEITAHTDFAGDAASNDWIELFNPQGTEWLLGSGWYLSDSRRDLQKWAIPEGRRIPPRGFLTFDEVTGFNAPAGSGFGLNKAGEEVLLSHFPIGGRARVVDAVQYPAQENGVSFARAPDGGPDWDQVTPRTRDLPNANAGARVGISEILFNPGGVPTNRLAAEWLEFIELHNGTSAPVPLHNTNAPWRLGGGISFQFPPSVVLAPGERGVVVAFDPVTETARAAAFRETFGVPTTVRFWGPFEGRLDNDVDRVTLERAQAGDPPDTPVSWALVDSVTYLDAFPWPEAADGEGMSLQRRDLAMPGSNPGAWSAAVPTPGAGGGVSADGDADGMPDAWEETHGLNPRDPADAWADADGDGMSNHDEYRAGTDPRAAGSALRVSARRAQDGTIRVEFEAVASRAYVLESNGIAGPGGWHEERRIPAGAGGGVAITVTLQAPEAARYFRVRLL